MNKLKLACFESQGPKPSIVLWKFEKISGHVNKDNDYPKGRVDLHYVERQLTPTPSFAKTLYATPMRNFTYNL